MRGIVKPGLVFVAVPVIMGMTVFVILPVRVLVTVSM
jgi:hypothetical protein